jgi:hypothetical protein
MKRSHPDETDALKPLRGVWDKYIVPLLPLPLPFAAAAAG